MIFHKYIINEQMSKIYPETTSPVRCTSTSFPTRGIHNMFDSASFQDYTCKICLKLEVKGDTEL